MNTTRTSYSSSRRAFLVVLGVLAVTMTSPLVVQAFAPSSQKSLNSLPLLQAHPPTNNNINEATTNNDVKEGSVSRRNAVKAAAMLVFGASSVMINGPMTAAYAETALDFSLPTYDTKMAGFGDGKEAILNTKGSADRTDPGANEREKQTDAMRKAEEARLEQKAKKLAERKAREDEDKRRAAEKKARDAERLKNIWNS